jgi:hypothetical protein
MRHSYNTHTVAATSAGHDADNMKLCETGN